MDGRTDNVKTVYPPQTKFAGGYNMLFNDEQEESIIPVRIG